MVALVVDVGTTNLKCSLFDEKGNEIIKAVRPNVTRYPKPFFAEQDPLQWVGSLIDALQEIRGLFPAKLQSIQVISLTGQMHGPVLLDPKENKVLYPCIIWSDTRASEEVELLERIFSRGFFLEKMRNPLQQSFTLPKLLWLKNHVPEIFKKGVKVLFPKDYIAYILSGTIATDPSDASGSLVLDLQKGEWAGEVLKELGFDSEILPDIVPSDSIVGYVSEEAAREFLLPAGVPIIKGGGDLATTALATGAGVRGNLSICVGTAGQVLICADEVNEEVVGKLYVFMHCVKDKYFYLATVPAGGASLDWFLSLYNGQSLWESIGKITSIPLQKSILFYPFLLGTGTPHFDYRAKAAVFGLQMHHKLEDIIVAILEGISFALRESVEEIPAVWEEVNRIVLSGGLARFPIFSEIVSYVFHRPVLLSRYVDTASMGAFLLAARAFGVGSVPQIAYEREIVPSESTCVQYYKRLYELYKCFLKTVLSFTSENHGLC